MQLVADATTAKCVLYGQLDDSEGSAGTFGDHILVDLIEQPVPPPRVRSELVPKRETYGCSTKPRDD
jgi:hypothetical protein